MTATLSLNMLLIWFLWGVFMGAGWTLMAWALGKVLR